MANKKSTGKKKSTSTKKSNKKVATDHNKKIESVGEFDADYKRIMLVSGTIVIIFCFWYTFNSENR